MSRTRDLARLHVDSDGNVGVGYDAPGAHIHVLGSTSSPTAHMVLQSNDTAEADAKLSLYSRDSSNVNQITSVRNHLGNTVIEGGNVGVGVSNPSTTLDVDGAVKVKAGAGETGGIKLHTNSGINASDNVMSFHTGQTDGFKFNINSDGADGNGTVVSITPAGNIVQQADYSNSRAIPEVYELEPYTINVGGYSRSWVKLFQFSTGGQQECQFRMHFQGDHNYNHLFMCQGQVHQWSTSTGNVNFYIIGQGGNLTGNFVFTSDHSCYWRPSGLWSDTGRFEVLSKTSGCTIMTDIANNISDGSAPSGTVYSFSGTGSTSGEINWGQ